MSSMELVFSWPGPRAAPWASTWAWLDPAAEESLDLREQRAKPQTCSCVSGGKGSCASHGVCFTGESHALTNQRAQIQTSDWQVSGRSLIGEEVRSRTQGLAVGGLQSVIFCLEIKERIKQFNVWKWLYHEESNFPWSYEIKEVIVLWKHMVAFRFQNFLQSPKGSFIKKESCKNSSFCTSATYFNQADEYFWTYHRPHLHVKITRTLLQTFSHKDVIREKRTDSVSLFMNSRTFRPKKISMFCEPVSLQRHRGSVGYIISNRKPSLIQKWVKNG